MNNNTIRARLAFSFKGEAYELDSVIDQDRWCGESGEVIKGARLESILRA